MSVGDFKDIQAGTEITTLTWNFSLPHGVTLMGTPTVTVTSGVDPISQLRLGPIQIGTAMNPDGSYSGSSCAVIARFGPSMRPTPPSEGIRYDFAVSCERSDRNCATCTNGLFASVSPAFALLTVPPTCSYLTTEDEQVINANSDFAILDVASAYEYLTTEADQVINPS